ncbi:MAG: hypothetical protein ABJF88_04975 [Rhodothermales bacterium]
MILAPHQLPFASAAIFGVAALAFSFAPLLFDEFALPVDSALIALFAVPPALLGGYFAGRHLSAEAHVAGRVYFALTGALVAVLSALTAAVFLLALLFASEGFESVLPALGYGMAFGLLASPFGTVAGLLLRPLAPEC